MDLLYCANGIVLGWHDSQMTAVPASAYGSGVRIIPYDQPLSTLEKVGPAPPPPTKDQPRQADTRPYAEPKETPELLRAFAGQVRFETVVAGIDWNGIPVHTDRMSQLLIGNLAAHAATVTPTDMIDFTQDAIGYQFEAQQAADLMFQVNSFVQQCRSAEATCLTDLSSGSPTILTYEDVEARFSSLRSETVQFGKK